MGAEQIMSFVYTFIISQCIFWILKQRGQIKKLNAEKEIIERSEERWENLYRSQISSLQSRIDYLLKYRHIDNDNISPDIVQAVKYAMKHAHPDNGGNAEDFIRFKKVYEKLTNN